MSTSFTYSVLGDTATGALCERTLHNQVVGSSIVPTLDRVDTIGDALTLIFNTDLSVAEEATLDGLISAHAGDILKVYKGIIKNAVGFFDSIMVVFAAENITMGITVAGKTKDVADYLATVLRYGQTGSLYEVSNEIDALIAATVPVDLGPFVTENRLNDFKAKITDYLT